MAHAMGFNTYGIMSSAYWGYFTAPLAVFPYPGTLAAFFYHNELLQVILILLLSLWFFGWAGSVFLSSTRMIFAAAFDRILPEWAARVDDRTHVPVGALALMLPPSIPISALYAYSTKFYGYTLDATLVIAITSSPRPWRRSPCPGGGPRSTRPRRSPSTTSPACPWSPPPGSSSAASWRSASTSGSSDGAYFVNNYESKCTCSPCTSWRSSSM